MVDGRFAAFVAVSTLLIMTPGPDMAMVTRNALRAGQRAASLTALGVSTGIMVWGFASILGLAVLLDRSAVAFTVLKMAGAAYLLFLGVRALLAGSGHSPEITANAPPDTKARTGDGTAFVQGLLGNVLNPKAGVIFVTVIPQFVHPGDTAVRLLAMLAVFEVILIVWLNIYSHLIIRAVRGRAGMKVRALINRATGVVLIGLGARVAMERA